MLRLSLRPKALATAALLLSLSTLTHCAHNSQVTGKPEVIGHEDELRKLAAFELGCNEQRLDVMRLTDESAAVTGCEKKAVYRWQGAWAQSSKEDAPAKP